MKLRLLLAIAVPLAGLAQSLPSLPGWLKNPHATVCETKVTLNTYPFSDPDPVPATDKPMYPYFRFDGQSANGVTQEWQAVVLENARIKVTALPGVGGKVWGALDKKTGKEFIYFNHAVKFRNIAMRGPWTSGGIELNFGILGHSPVTATPVDYTIRTNLDGSVSYFAAATEYICRTFWQVEVRLGADDDFFTTHVTWFNGSAVNAPYYTWMTGAYKASGDPKFYFPGADWIGHEGAHHSWPVDEKARDLTDYHASAFGGSRSFHVINGDTRFFGIWWPKDGYGSYHENLAGEKFGRKIFFWAHSRQGGIWEDLLTDTDGQYIELQSGRAFQQPYKTTWATPFKHPTFAPGATDRYTEKWGVAHDLKLLEKHMAAKELPAARPREMPKDFDWSSAYGLYMKGQQFLRERHDQEGREALEASIATNACFAPALTCLASHEYERGHDGRAAELANRALALDSYDPEANYVAGLVAAAADDAPTAYDRLGLAAFSPLYRAPALCAYAKLALKKGDVKLAAEVASKALAANPVSPEAALLVSAIARRGGKAKAEDLAAVERLAGELPLHWGLQYECAKRRGEDAAPTLKMRCELPSWNLVELGDWYESAGLIDEAKELFALAGDDALALVRLGKYETAAKRPAAFVLPFRRGDSAALERAAQANSSWKFRYWFALYRAAKGDDAEADRLLALCDEADEGSFYLYRARRRTGAERLADLEKARKLDDGWRPLVALADYWEEEVSSEGRGKDSASTGTAVDRMLEVTTVAAKRFPTVNPVEIAHARALQLAGKNRECVDYLKSVVILPSELGKRDNASGIWKAACEALGETELAESYPENLGTGKPFPPETMSFKARLTDPVAWLYPDSKVEGQVPFGEIDVAANGVADVNVLLNGLDVTKPLEFTSDVAGGEWFEMVDVQVERNTGVDLFTIANGDKSNPYVTRLAPFRVYDALKPVTKSFLPRHNTAALRYRLDRFPVKKGSFVAHLTVKQGEVSRTFAWQVNVHDVTLPAVGKNSFKYTNWFNFDNFANRHGLKMWSEEYYAMLEKYVRLAVKGRQNTAWITVSSVFELKDGQPVLNFERFRRIAEIYRRAGIWYIEGGHVARHHNGAWGAPTLDVSLTKRMTSSPEGVRDMESILRQFSDAAERLQLKDGWYQHVSDEPSQPSAAEYLKACAVVRRAMPWAKILDAVELPDVMDGMDVIVPKVDHWQKDRLRYAGFAAKHPGGNWCYVCCIPRGKWMNRLLDGNLLCPVLIPWCCTMFDIDGFLHWGYNMYGKNQNPFENTCCERSEQPLDYRWLPTGDTHIVYPGTDGPWPGVRLEAHRAGMEDCELLLQLRRRDPVAAGAIVRRLARGFDDYSTDAELYRRVKRELFAELERQTIKGVYE